MEGVEREGGREGGLTWWIDPSWCISPSFVLVSNEGYELWVGLTAGRPSEVTSEAGLPVLVGSCISHGLAYIYLSWQPCVEVDGPNLWRRRKLNGP